MRAEVRYRVVREVRYPDWWFCRCWWWPTDSGSQEIAHGRTTTAVDGSYSITFTAEPDRTVPPVSEPIFSYTVYVDVVDSTGETRSTSRSVHVGYTALAASLSLDAWQVDGKPVSVRISTRTLDGEPQPAQGTLEVYRLQSPPTVHRPPLTGRYRPWNLPVLGRSTEKLPDMEPVWSDIKTWPHDDRVHQQSVTIDSSGFKLAEVQLPAGAYRIRLKTQDRFGKPVQTEYVFQVYDLEAQQYAVKQADDLVAPQWSVEPGSDFVALWGTGYESSRAYVEIECRGKTIERYWTDGQGPRRN